MDVALDSPGSGKEENKNTGDNDDADSKLNLTNRAVKQEKDVSSESDTNVSAVEKPGRTVSRPTREEKAARENKENMKCSVTSRNNSADAVEKGIFFFFNFSE